MPLTAGQTFGVNAGTSALSAGFGILSSYLSNKWARENAEHDREENYKYNELAAGNADARTRALYNDLYSPQALMQQLKDAGLSPSVFYANGAGGISGQSGAQGEGASGLRQDTFGIPNVTPLDLSQIELNKAQARNLNADANEKERSMDERIRKWFLENQNNELRNTYIKWENAIKRLEYGIKEQYDPEQREAEIKNINENTNLVVEQIRSEKVKGNINEQTEQQQIEAIVNRNKQIIADVALKNAEKRLAEAKVKLTNEQVENLISSIWQGWKELDIKEDTLNLEDKRLEAIINQWNVENNFRGKEFKLNVGRTIIESLMGEQKIYMELLKNNADLAAFAAR